MCAYNLFVKKCKNEEEIEKVNNEHSMLIDEYDDDKEEDYEMKYHKMKKEVSYSAVKMNDDNQKNKSN